MLQVKKKNRKKGNRKPLLLLMTAIVIASGLFALTALRREEPVPARTDTRGSIVNRAPSEIAWLRITVRGREPWTAGRNGEGKLCVGGEDGWAMDQALGERIEDALANVVYEDILTENREEYQKRLAEFGLEDPMLTAEVRYTDGTGLTLRIGDESGLEDEDFRFMTVDGDDRLYAVAGSFAEDLMVEEELLHPVAQPDIQTARIDRITIRDGEERILAEWALEGNVTDTDAAANWKLTVPVVYPADQDQMNSLKKNAGNLRLGIYVGEATEENLRKYGLEQPERVIEIHMAAAATGQISESGALNVTEQPEETVRFVIGSRRNEMTEYCLADGAVYTVNRFTEAALTEVSPMDTLARYPVTTALENLSSLEVIREGGETVLYELTRTYAEPAEEGGEGETETVCTRNGESIPYQVFEAAYERMLTVNVSGQLPENWEKRETRETYVFRTLSGRTERVELSGFDAMHDAVTVNGRTLFYLIRGGMGELP